MSINLKHIDPDLPEESGRILARIPNEEVFQVPENYFQNLEKKIASKVGIAESDDFFAKQQDELMAQIRLEKAFGRSNPFEVPDGYFNSLSDSILIGSKKIEEGKVIDHPSRWHKIAVPAIAVAASIAVVLFFIDTKAPKESFADLLEQSDLTENDLSYFATEDDFFDLYLDEVDQWMADTLIVTDSIISSPQDSLPSKTPIEKDLSPKDKKVKPSKENDIPKWDDLTEEEILEYLMEDGGDDILNDLN